MFSLSDSMFSVDSQLDFVDGLDLFCSNLEFDNLYAKTICVVVRITCFHIRLGDQFVYITCFLIGFNDPIFVSDFENAFFSLVLTFDCSSWNSLPQYKLLGLCFVYGFKHSR
ncbi:uncharacterized protein G2W53_026360 [Senna tora]|uniref:Uncharacterized protein n=1 Tax=Senna tora TaxID=362788 RepID=A0A834TFL5_9FABA|nr:uncharacterized protein G2W53_026360 [Senna tora]